MIVNGVLCINALTFIVEVSCFLQSCYTYIYLNYRYVMSLKCLKNIVDLKVGISALSIATEILISERREV